MDGSSRERPRRDRPSGLSGRAYDGADRASRKDGALAPSAYPRREPRPRIPEFGYIGPFAYHVILLTQDRAARFQDIALGQRCTQILREVAVACDFRLLAFCFMPNHLHMLVLGNGDASNLLRFVQRFNQKTAYQFKQQTRERFWQQSFYDRALRVDEDLPTVAEYIFNNPIKAGLVTSMNEYALSGGEYAANEAEASSLRPAAEASHG